MTTLLEVERVSKSYGGIPAVRDVSLQVAPAEVVALLGPSGCGKTTLLRIIAGLETPDVGTVRFAGQDMALVPAHRRGFGLMFQDYALFPHQDVFQNVAFGLEMQRMQRAQVKARVEEMLELVGLTGYEHRRVFELSGGEQQRVALARSLAPQPRLLMLDEPLGSLDRALREQLLEELRQILRRVGVTALYVTHDQQEAFAVADRVVIMRTGRVVQEGKPEDVYCHPADAFVARFLGLPNLIHGRVVAPGRVETALGTLSVPAASLAAPQAAVTVLIRPEAAVLDADDHVPNLVRGRVVDRSFRGSQHRLRTAHAGDIVLELDVRALDQRLPGPGEEITLSLQPAGLSLLTSSDGEQAF